MDNYVGKIVKISGADSWGREFTTVGVVCAQREGSLRDRTVFSIIKTDGTLADSVAIMHNSDAKITATKIEPKLRAALKEAYKFKLKLDAFEEKYKKELQEHKNAFVSALNGVKENSNDLTSFEFIDAVVSLFEEKYPSSGDYYTKRFEADCWSPTEVTVKQSQDVDKWANPEKYSFLYREYDNTIHVHYDSKSFKEFCERNAPRIIPELEKHCKVDVSGSLGDKEWLSAERTYTFPIKYGYSKKSIEDIKERLFGIRVKQQSVDEQIAAAERQKGSSGVKKDNINKER